MTCLHFILHSEIWFNSLIGHIFPNVSSLSDSFLAFSLFLPLLFLSPQLLCPLPSSQILFHFYPLSYIEKFNVSLDFVNLHSYVAAQISVLLGNNHLKKAEALQKIISITNFFLLPQDPIWLDISLLSILYLSKIFIFCSFLHYFSFQKCCINFFILILNLLLRPYILCPRPYMPGPLITCENFVNKILCTFISIIFLKYKLKSLSLTSCIRMFFFPLTRSVFQLKNQFLLI